MEQGDLIRVKITDISNEGNGIARAASDGNSLDRVIFVQNSTFGDEVLFLDYIHYSPSPLEDIVSYP